MLTVIRYSPRSPAQRPAGAGAGAIADVYARVGAPDPETWSDSATALAILVSVSPAATLVEALEPLRRDPLHAAVLLDIDGTLAPIVRHAADAHVPEATRTLLIEIAKRYRIVGCISGRRATTARQIVAIGTIAYIGNHGGELLLPGATRAELDSELAGWAPRVRAFAATAHTPERQRLRIRGEDKDTIAAFHWRGAPDEEAAAAAVADIAREASEQGLAVHWGRKVLEVRPPVELHKGLGIAALLRDQPVSTAVYVGDDTTDLDAFRGLRALVQPSGLEYALCVAVGSDETPSELAAEADLLIDGAGGVRGLLEALL
jgi:trehalose 6-phosphate phosphatase